MAANAAKRAAGILALLLCLCLSLTVQADTPYGTFESTVWESGLAAPDFYKPVFGLTGTQMGSEPFTDAEDFTFDKDGNLYIVDALNDRIGVYDASFRFAGYLSELHTAEGETSRLRQPKSLYVADDGYLYIADTGNSRCVKVDKDGLLVQSFLMPDSASYTAETYEPIRVLVDVNGMVYIISDNVYQGVLMYDQQGEFQGYYGSPPVRASLRLLADRFWKSIMSNTQRELFAQYVPVEYDSMTLGEDGYIYVVSAYTDSQTEQIRKLNALGSNILKYTKDFSMGKTLEYKRIKWYTRFSDVAMANGLIFALDFQWQRVYVYDSDGNRLGVFGTQGEQQGAFRQAVAVETRGDTVYVLDKSKGSITGFTLTEYGATIVEAVELYNRGDYTEAIEPWSRVLAMSANNELAYTGIAEAKLKLGEYKEAVEYFRLGNSPERESVAFSYYRSDFLRQNIGWVFAILGIVLVSLVLLTEKHFLAFLSRALSKAREGKPPRRMPAMVTAVFPTMTSPIRNFNELKFKRYSSFSLTLLVVVALYAVHVFKRQFYGFRFNLYNPDEFSLLMVFAVTVFPFLLFVVSNWAVCALTNGEGKFGEVATFTAISLVPYILFQAVAVVFSNALLLEEQAFLSGLEVVGVLWSLVLFFHAQRIVHNFSTGKVLGMVLLSVLGIAVILIILLLIFALGQQVWYFVTTIYSELQYR